MDFTTAIKFLDFSSVFDRESNKMNENEGINITAFVAIVWQEIVHSRPIKTFQPEVEEPPQKVPFKVLQTAKCSSSISLHIVITITNMRRSTLSHVQTSFVKAFLTIKLPKLHTVYCVNYCNNCTESSESCTSNLTRENERRKFRSYKRQETQLQETMLDRKRWRRLVNNWSKKIVCRYYCCCYL